MSNLPKCRVEFKWVLDIFWFLGFFLLGLLIPIIEVVGYLEIFAFAGIGFCLGMAILREHSRFYVVLISFIIVIVLFIPRFSTEVINFVSQILNLIRYFIYSTSWIMLGTLLGAISFSIYNYTKCKRGN